MKPCCADPENRRPGPGPRGLNGAQREDETVEHCVVCTCRHYELTVDPLEIGLTFRSINEEKVTYRIPGTSVVFQP